MAVLGFVTSEGEVDARALDGAIDRGTSMMLMSLGAATPDGERHWDAPCDLGPASTAQVLVALAHAGVITDEERTEGSRWLRARQHADGGFPAYPNAPDGHVGATASALAALLLCAGDDNRAAIARARSFIASHGGLDAVVAALGTGDVGALFLALAGELEARKLPNPPLFWTLIGPVVSFLETRTSAALPFLALQLGTITRRLRGDFGRDGKQHGWLEGRECRACIETLTEFQNDDGSWNANTMQTAMAIPALWAAGVPRTDARYQRAIAWMRTQMRRDHDGIWFQSFGSGVWSTALDLAALMASGHAPADAPMEAALRWLTNSQCRRLQPVPNNRKPNAIRNGGWAFQRGNDLFADCDDTGVVLATLGEALAVQGKGAIAPALASEIEAATKRGIAWIANMQNDDGGWAAFIWGLPGKGPGPAMRKPLKLSFTNPLAMIGVVIDPPLQLGDPSCEDLTGRVLCGLGACGKTTADPMVQRAIQFLRTMQCTDGSFWGRWTMNFVAATAWVILGAMAVDADPDDAWLKNAVQWLRSRQNPDGGWGETTASYRDPDKERGKGPSNPPLTGIVVQALVSADLENDTATKRAVNYLIRTQSTDGTWPSNGYLAPNIPPDTFYSYPETERHNPLRALARYRAEIAHPSPRPGEPDSARWNDLLLDRARTMQDAGADAVIDTLMADHAVERADKMFMRFLRSDEPIPDGLPAAAKQYFEDTEAMPSWADPQQIDIAQKLFVRTGWQIAAGLFCAALPQAYAAANGATALSQTSGMRKDNVGQRVFETAQFLFDVAEPGSFGPTGRGIRAAQKVRLMHAAVRRLIHDTNRFDTTRFGQPLNQEDMAGTLMTFSVVTLDALRSINVPYTHEEGEAWLHLWKVVAHYLGVDPELVPVDVEDGRALMAAIRRRQWSRSDAGKDLTATLIYLMRKFGPAPLGDMPVALIRHMSGDYCADLLGVPRPNWNRFLFELGLEITRKYDYAAGHSPADELMQRAMYLIMGAVVSAARGFKPGGFRIPTALDRTVLPGT